MIHSFAGTETLNPAVHKSPSSYSGLKLFFRPRPPIRPYPYNYSVEKLDLTPKPYSVIEIITGG